MGVNWDPDLEPGAAFAELFLELQHHGPVPPLQSLRGQRPGSSVRLLRRGSRRPPHHAPDAEAAPCGPRRHGGQTVVGPTPPAAGGGRQRRRAVGVRPRRRRHVEGRRRSARLHLRQRPSMNARLLPRASTPSAALRTSCTDSALLFRSPWCRRLSSGTAPPLGGVSGSGAGEGAMLPPKDEEQRRRRRLHLWDRLWSASTQGRKEVRHFRLTATTAINSRLLRSDVAKQRRGERNGDLRGNLLSRRWRYERLTFAGGGGGGQRRGRGVVAVSAQRRHPQEPRRVLLQQNHRVTLRHEKYPLQSQSRSVSRK